MYSIICLFGFLALTSSLPIDEEGVSLIQDNVGNYKLNYKTVDSTREEQGFDDGKVVGSYSFLDINGTSHAINYVADPVKGFLVEGDVATETPEVAKARAYHLAIVEATRALLPELPEEEEEQQVQPERVVKILQPTHAPKQPAQHEVPQHHVKTSSAHNNRNQHILGNEKSVRLIAPKNIKISPADLERLTLAIKAAKASNTPLENIRVAPAAAVVQEEKVMVDNTAEIEAAKAELFAAHKAAIANLANEYRKAAIQKARQEQ